MSNVKLPTPAPVQLFARCVNAAHRPTDHIGDWPEAGRVYHVRQQRHAATRQLQVRVLGFYAEHPYGAFAPNRFVPVAEVWLN